MTKIREMVTTASTSLEEAKQWLRDNVYMGAFCPLCGQFAKVYKRPIDKTTAQVLIRAYKAHKTDWFHLPSFYTERGDVAKARYWALLEEDTSAIPAGGASRAGYWRLTEAGVDFILNKSTIQKYALVYDSRCLGLDGPLIGIKDALTTKFSYDELMA